MNWNIEEKIKYCPHCRKKQPIEFTYFNPDDDDEPEMELIVCLIRDLGVV